MTTTPPTEPSAAVEQLAGPEQAERVLQMIRMGHDRAMYSPLTSMATDYLEQLHVSYLNALATIAAHEATIARLADALESALRATQGNMGDMGQSNDSLYREYRERIGHARSIIRAALTSAAADAGPASSRPTVVCLCGSTRFMDAFHDANRRLSLEGKIVLGVAIVTYDGATDPQRADEGQKERLDELHLRKIDLADEVHVLNVGGYIGESTRRELDYARQHGKTIRFLEEADHA